MTSATGSGFIGDFTIGNGATLRITSGSAVVQPVGFTGVNAALAIEPGVTAIGAVSGFAPGA